MNTHIIFSYAITRLKQAPDDDLVLYLLQLVQALKYENFDDIEVSIGFNAHQSKSIEMIMTWLIPFLGCLQSDCG